mmetsp:Transcript_17268/g.39021  ORF Transcript_17268/g.39021 Transcript_17268/m.39021 type:complete len:104 (+) Transcript_17268:132-443(+)|eukprot:CAMPEP_0173194658 /NCGR_PEP_ID=MMETSP1141-20130122/14627_1 /TAXON_ID=483371 /ORGANISM="non described non described, Strain CCMP2298" /LENGTH=103 /DNA_ID=CAMNT_0014119111 /DNA_START=54 /DNA_END=365 /DNA_ORIENTATION=+
MSGKSDARPVIAQGVDHTQYSGKSWLSGKMPLHTSEALRERTALMKEGIKAAKKAGATSIFLDNVVRPELKSQFHDYDNFMATSFPLLLTAFEDFMSAGQGKV